MSSFFNQRAEIYDNHMLDEMSLTEFYDEIEQCIKTDKSLINLLDLGCGTGLELERVFKLYKDAKVTAIDLSEKMLEKLRQKLEDKISNLTLICGSYFDIDFGSKCFDFVISTYSLHHFSHEEKLTLYKRVYDAMQPGGKFINGDYTVKSVDQEKYYMEENIRIRKEQGITEGFYHYDTPLAVETELCLLKLAGFERIEIQKQWESTSIFVSYK
jgi:tRNA (cmo5U34)-methyltransferase